MRENLWPILQEAFNAITPYYQEQIREAMAEIGFEGPDWYMSYLAFGLDPEPLTAVTLHKLQPYANNERQKELLKKTAEKGFLETNKHEEYMITAKGRRGIETFFEVARAAIGQIDPMPKSQMDTLAITLQNIVDNTLAAPEQVNKRHLKISRATDFDENANAAVRIDQYLTDLLRYRDDAHLAAWQSLPVNGPAWEAFTLFWRGEVSTLDELVENRKQRGFETAVYTHSLKVLRQLGWLKKVNDTYQVTENGSNLRDQVEKQTNANFFVGIAKLKESDIEALTSLLIQFKEGLAIPEKEPIPA